MLQINTVLRHVSLHNNNFFDPGTDVIDYIHTLFPLFVCRPLAKICKEIHVTKDMCVLILFPTQAWPPL
jgi:hypothetical protein